MCRHHLPGWQEAWEARQDENGVQFLAVAMDGQGWEVAGPWVEKAEVSFPAVVDREGALWEQLDFDVVPIQILFDEQGREILRTKGAPTPELLARIDQAVAGGTGGPAAEVSLGGTHPEAQSLFARGSAALAAGDRERAASLWKQALERDPNNWLIRKQIWALENPDRFYEGDIDSDWQRELMRDLRE